MAQTAKVPAVTEERNGLLAVPRELMPKDLTVSLHEYTRGGTDRFLAGGQGVSQEMTGFEDQYVNIIDYIVRITHRIWEEKDIGYIYDTYAHNCRVWDDVGLQYGRDKIVADTTHTINAFPDVKLYADEIIWAGDADHGFHTSHRTVIKGTNTGYSRWGPPTMRPVNVWCIANCVARDNEIFEEHVQYNLGATLQQLGFDLRALAATARATGIETDPLFAASGRTRVPGQGKPAHGAPRGDGPFDVADFLCSMTQDVWNRRMLSRLERAYAPALNYQGPTNRSYRSLAQYQSALLSLLAMFPDLSFEPEALYFMEDGQGTTWSSLRWSATGTHGGHGPYGPPTGREVRLWGITQHKIEGETITEEWMQFNEFDLLRQLAPDPTI